MHDTWFNAEIIVQNRILELIIIWKKNIIIDLRSAIIDLKDTNIRDLNLNVERQSESKRIWNWNEQK